MKKLSVAASAALLAASIGAAQGAGFMPWTDIMKMADTNKDGAVSPMEVMTFKFATEYPGFQPFIATHFMRLDTNEDGMISVAEFHSQMAEMEMADGDVNQAFSIGSGFMPWDDRS